MLNDNLLNYDKIINSSITIDIIYYIMSNILNWFLNFLQQRQLIVPQSDQAYRQNYKKNTVIIQIILKFNKLKTTVIGYINKLNHLDNSTKNTIWMVIAMCIGLFLYWLHNKYGKNQPQSPKKPERQDSKQGLKKNASFVSIKQYQSHSNSDSNSSRENRSKLNHTHDKQTKIAKQYCTDIETDPHNVHYQSALEKKRDKFFFHLMGSFKNQKKDNHQIHDQNSELDYECQYEGQQENSPVKFPAVPTTMVGEIPKINVQ